MLIQGDSRCVPLAKTAIERKLSTGALRWTFSTRHGLMVVQREGQDRYDLFWNDGKPQGWAGATFEGAVELIAQHAVDEAPRIAEEMGIWR